MQHLEWDTTEMEELQEEVTRAQAAAVMAGARSTHAEGMAPERTVL
jgi:hypothetical protein